MTIQAILFDLGGVLLRWNPLALYQKHFPHLAEQEIRAFFDEVNFSAWNLEQDRGRPYDEGVAELSARFPHRAALIRAYHEHWPDCIGGTIDGTVRILEQFSENGLKIIGLTNFSSEKLALIRPQFDFFRHFNDVIVSGEVKLVKPDPAIYHLTLNRIGCQAQECVFIDDSLPNIEAARQLGFHAIHFQSSEQLQVELEQIL
ncbi:MAG: HAD-IA family hydrolase [Anaerolineales bacterium]